jgi:hypothetical protein
MLERRLRRDKNIRVDKGDSKGMIHKQTNKQINKVLVISILLNVIFMLLFLSAVYYKRDSIAYKINEIINRPEVSENVLLTFNQEPYNSINGELNKHYDKTINILFLGNSLTLCGVPEEESDREHERGLTSTSMDKDYVHLLINKISDEKQVNIKYSIINIADFERNFSKLSFNYTQLKNATVQKPDIVIFQIGENVSKEDISLYGKVYIDRFTELVQMFSNSRRIVCLPFWPDIDKIKATTKVALETESAIVDLSHLGNGLDISNFAYSKKEYKQPGVGMHPGDTGMQNIADVIYSVIK